MASTRWRERVRDNVEGLAELLEQAPGITGRRGEEQQEILINGLPAAFNCIQIRTIKFNRDPSFALVYENEIFPLACLL